MSPLGSKYVSSYKIDESYIVNVLESTQGFLGDDFPNSIAETLAEEAIYASIASFKKQERGKTNIALFLARTDAMYGIFVDTLANAVAKHKYCLMQLRRKERTDEEVSLACYIANTANIPLECYASAYAVLRDVMIPKSITKTAYVWLITFDVLNNQMYWSYYIQLADIKWKRNSSSNGKRSSMPKALLKITKSIKKMCTPEAYPYFE